MFCLWRFGFTHQNVTIYPFFLFSWERKPSWHMVKKKTYIWKIDAWESSFIFNILVCEYHKFCLSRLGFTRQNFKNNLFFPCFLNKKRPLHIVKQKHRYGQLMPVSWDLIFIEWCGCITCFACQNLASPIKILQITNFSCVFSGNKTPKHDEKET
jgi:hypothetical protein